MVSDSNNFKKSEAILRNLEIKYRLTQVKDSKKAETKAVKKGELEMVIRTGEPSDKMLLQEKMKTLLDRPNLTITDMIRQGKKEGIYFLFNQASNGRITGITYFHEDFKIKGQALGNRFKWAEIIKKVGYEQTRDSKTISEANDSTRAAYGQSGPAAGERTGSARTSDLGTALPDPAELAERSEIDERDSKHTGKDMAADEPARDNSVTADGGMETAQEGPDADRVLLDNWGHIYMFLLLLFRLRTTGMMP